MAKSKRFTGCVFPGVLSLMIFLVIGVCFTLRMFNNNDPGYVRAVRQFLISIEEQGLEQFALFSMDPNTPAFEHKNDLETLLNMGAHQRVSLISMSRNGQQQTPEANVLCRVDYKNAHLELNFRLTDPGDGWRVTRCTPTH